MTDKNRAATDDSRKTFEQLARDLECDEDEAAFEKVVKKVATTPPPKAPEQPE